MPSLSVDPTPEPAAAPVEKPSSRQITYGPDAGVFLFDPSKDQEKDLKPV